MSEIRNSREVSHLESTAYRKRRNRKLLILKGEKSIPDRLLARVNADRILKLKESIPL